MLAQLSPLSTPNKPVKPNYYETFQKRLTEARYENVVEQVILKAEGGDLRAARLIMEHAQGKPTQRIEFRGPQDEALNRLQQLLAERGQPVEFAVVDGEYAVTDEGETEPHATDPQDNEDTGEW